MIERSTQLRFLIVVSDTSSPRSFRSTLPDQLTTLVTSSHSTRARSPRTYGIHDFSSVVARTSVRSGGTYEFAELELASNKSTIPLPLVETTVDVIGHTVACLS